MADLQLQVPQDLEDGLDQPLMLRRRLGLGQEHEIDVAERRHLAAAGAAEADDGHRRDVRVAGDEIVSETDDLVVEVGRCAGGGASGVGLKVEATSDLCPALLQGGAQQFGRETVAVAAGRDRREAVRDRPPIDDRALVLDAVEERSAHPCLALHMAII